jgi:transcriptional regulator with XRE-family HTH domain
VSVAVRTEDVGGRIADARRELGLTQKYFAERVGITMWLLDRIEHGLADAGMHLSAIADMTGRSPAWFGSASATALRQPKFRRRRFASAIRAQVMTGRDLVLASLTLLVLIRFFTEVVPVLPRAANFIDIPIFLVLSVAALVRLQHRESAFSVAFPVVLFLFVCAISVTVNTSRVALAPALVFLYGFLAPVAVGAATFRLWPAGHASILSRLIVALGVIQLVVVAVIDLPRFLVSGDPDVVSGTFGTNAYQLVFFLLVFMALLAGIFTFEKQRLSARLALPLFAGILTTVFLAQYRALLATTALTVIFVGLLLGARGRGIVATAIVVATFGMSLAYVAQHFPELRFASTIETLRHDPSSYASERLKAARSVMRLYTDHPAFALTGTGPGTFSSRAWQTFARANSKSRSNVQGRYVRVLTGASAYHTDVSDKYVAPVARAAPVIGGSRAVTSPFSSYISLLAEVGTIGFLLIVGVYVAATARSTKEAVRTSSRADPEDPLTALVLASATGFFVLLQMGLLENWLEVTRVTFIVWMLFGVVTKELKAREHAAA